MIIDEFKVLLASLLKQITLTKVLLLRRGRVMASISKKEEILEAAVAGIPKVAELVASIPEQDRTRALDAAERSYRQTVLNLGYEEGPAEAWVSAIMVRLQAEAASKPAARPSTRQKKAG